MKNIIFALSLVVFAWTLMSSGCDSGGGGGVTTFNAPSASGPKGSSTARFTINNNRLYIVNKKDLSIYDVTNASTLKHTNTVTIGNDIETIYPFKNRLFMASNVGMYAYDISNPDKPSNGKFVQHITGCDPVIANDSMVWLTIHGGTNCRGNINELQVYEIGTSLESIKMLYRVSMNSPRGLGLQNNSVYVCNNTSGLEIVNATKKYANLQHTNYAISGLHFFDLIPYGNNLICQTNKGIAYLDVSNTVEPKLISQINE